MTFEVPRGSSLGIIGDNGAGKSTRLKIPAGTTRPTSGTAVVNGRVASILELGAAFHGDFSGRENARMNALLLGFASDEAEARLPGIQEFAEPGDFFDLADGMAVESADAPAEKSGS